MTITRIIGTTSVDEETAVRQLLAIIGRGGSCTADLKAGLDAS